MDDLSKQLGGFNYDNCIRNKALAESGASALAASSLSFKKTGTTICGAIFNVSFFNKELIFFRKELYWQLILELQEDQL